MNTADAWPIIDVDPQLTPRGYSTWYQETLALPAAERLPAFRMMLVKLSAPMWFLRQRGLRGGRAAKKRMLKNRVRVAISHIYYEQQGWGDQAAFPIDTSHELFQHLN